MICYDLFIFIHIKISYYWYKRQEFLRKAKDKYHNYGGNEKAAEYYCKNKDVIKEKANNKYKNLSEQNKQAKKEYQKNRYEKMKKKSSQIIKMRYYWFNRSKILKNVWNKYENEGGKEKYYAANEDVLTEDARNKYRSLSKKEKEKKRKY